jgi:hypothetical protein
LPQVWNLHSLASKWNVRPSAFLGLEDYEAFCLDQAITYVGFYIQGKLDNIKLGKGKKAEERRRLQQDSLLNTLLYGESKKPRKFRDPAVR